MKGIHAIRLSHLIYDQTDNQDLPELDIFVKNRYMKYLHHLPEEGISEDRIKAVIRLNCISAGKKTAALYGIRSLINHSKFSNIFGNSDEIILNYAKTDILKGEELLIDYCPHIDDPEKRNDFLLKYGF